MKHVLLTQWYSRNEQNLILNLLKDNDIATRADPRQKDS